MATPTLHRIDSPSRMSAFTALPLDTLTALQPLVRAGATVHLSDVVALGNCQSTDCTDPAEVVLVTVRPGVTHQGFTYAVRVCLTCATQYALADLRRGATASVLVPAPTRAPAA